MWIKCFHPQEVVIRIVILLQPFRCMPHGLYTWIIVLCVEVGTIFMLCLGPRPLIPFRRYVRSNPVSTRPCPNRIALLTSIHFPCGKALHIVFSSANQVVRMIGKHLCMGLFLLRKNTLQTLIKRFHRPPWFFHEIQPSRHDITTGRHTWGGAAPMTVKYNRSTSQTVDVRCNGCSTFCSISG